MVLFVDCRAYEFLSSFQRVFHILSAFTVHSAVKSPDLFGCWIHDWSEELV